MCTIIPGHEHHGAPAITPEGIVVGAVTVGATVACYRVLEVAWPILLPMWAVAVAVAWMPCWARAVLRSGVAAIMRLIGQGVAVTHAAILDQPQPHHDQDAITGPTANVVLRNRHGEIVAQGQCPVIGGSRQATIANATQRYIEHRRQQQLVGRAS